MLLNPDFKDMLFEFTAANVEFLLIGAYALAVHGYPRATGDLDLWVRPEPKNATRVYAALASFGAPLTDLSVDDLAAPDVVFQIGVEPSRIDILTTISGVEFNDAWTRRLERRDSLAAIVKNYREWEKGFVRTDGEDGKSRYSGKLSKSKQDFYVIIDSGKGNWPVEMAVGDPATIRQELSIEKFKGVWLPKRTIFLHSGKTSNLELDWHSVNRPLDDVLFELEDVEKKYGFLTKRK